MSAPPVIPGPLGRRPRRGRAAIRRRLLPALTMALLALSRILDVIVAVSLLALLAPLFAWRILAARSDASGPLAREVVVGRFRVPFERLSFRSPGRGRGAPVLLNVLRGDMSLVGPAPLTPDRAERWPVAYAARFDVRPGLVSAFRLQRRTGIAHDDEAFAEQEAVWARTLRGDLGIVARTLPVALLSGVQAAPAAPELEFFGLRIANASMSEALDWLVAAAKSETATTLAFVNPHCLNVAYADPVYREALLGCTRILPDGVGIHLGCRVQGSRLRSNVNGTDLFPRLCERAAEEGLSIYLLGARPGVAELAAEEMRKRFADLRIAGVRDGYFDPGEEPRVIDEIARSGAQILFVAFGVPKQEIWLHAHRESLAVPLRLGVGGLFDFYSGRIPRAPLWFREIGLEWAWRLAQEPGRMWRRYVIGNPLFLWRVWRETVEKRRLATRRS